jgi:hypothetical protein
MTQAISMQNITNGREALPLLGFAFLEMENGHTYGHTLSGLLLLWPQERVPPVVVNLSQPAVDDLDDYQDDVIVASRTRANAQELVENFPPPLATLSSRRCFA